MTAHSSVPALRAQGLKKTYSNNVNALDGVSFDVQPGDFFALLGPNGAGKSTLIGIMSSLVTFNRGHVSVFDADVMKDREKAMRYIGLVPQEINFNLFERPMDILLHYAGFYGISSQQARQLASQELERAQLSDKAYVMSRTLSGGMKRRLMIARAMMTRPRLLILDEPTAGVDIEIRRSMWQTLKHINAQGTTIILTTHYLEEAEYLCRNLAIMQHGKIIEQGPMRRLLAKLDSEGFILDLDSPLECQLPSIAGVLLTAIDAVTIEIEKPRDIDLSSIFAALHAAHIKVRSMRTKSNRLEELFVRLTSAPQAVSG